MLDPKEHDPRCYNRPTADKVAVIIVQPEDDDETFQDFYKSFVEDYLVTH